jgi:hypothetical protein
MGKEAKSTGNQTSLESSTAHDDEVHVRTSITHSVTRIDVSLAGE